MSSNFKNFLTFSEYVSQHGAILVPEAFDWAKDISKLLPGLGLDLPVIEKKAKIEMVLDKKNPIYVQLSDGSKMFFTWDEFKRIDGKPERGKTMVVTMQRLPEDRSELPSQIMKCRVV